MTCEEVRDELVAYTRGELSEARRRAVEEHLVRCEGCARELEGTRQVLALTRMADDASVAELADSLIKDAIRRGASDIHLEMGHQGPRVRLRIDGVLGPGPELAAEQYRPLVARIKLMAAMNIAESRVPQDGRIGLSLGGKEFDLRVSVFPYMNAEGVVVRILDHSSVLIGLDRLGFTPESLSAMRALLDRPQGMILVAGPTAAGKTTTIYSMLQHLNRPEVKVMTIEDPIECQLPGVNQARVDARAGLTFASAVRSFLRQDPDILMVGELPDLYALEACCQAAMTGHLVLTTLHTRDSTEAVNRLVEMGLEPFLIASSVAGVVGQRLARRVCTECKEAYTPPVAVLSALGYPETQRPQVLHRGRGCERCRGTGFRGRTGLFEVLTIDDDLCRLIAEHPPEATLRARALELGLLRSFAADVRGKVTEGLTTAEEAMRVLHGVSLAGP